MDRSPDPGQLLTADEVAQRWRVPSSFVYRLAREGKLETVQLGRYRRWRLEAVEAHERGETKSAAT